MVGLLSQGKLRGSENPCEHREAGKLARRIRRNISDEKVVQVYVQYKDSQLGSDCMRQVMWKL